MPNLKFKEFLRKVTTEDIINKMTEGSHACPPAVGSVDMNTFNRDKTTRKHNYGPLNVDEPGDYWIKVAKQWRATIKAAKMSLCANCIAFDISPRMKECMPGVSSDGEGELGYCWMHHFKCHSRRSCNTWAKGGPIVDDKVSYTWHDRSNLEESKIDESVKVEGGPPKDGGPGSGAHNHDNKSSSRFDKVSSVKSFGKNLKGVTGVTQNGSRLEFDSNDGTTTAREILKKFGKGKVKVTSIPDDEDEEGMKATVVVTPINENHDELDEVVTMPSSRNTTKPMAIKYTYTRNPDLFSKTLSGTKTGKTLKNVGPKLKGVYVLKGKIPDHIDFLKTLNSKGIMPNTKIIPEEIEEDAPANSVSAGGVDMAPNAGHPNLMMKHKKKNKKDQDKLTKKIGNMIKDKKDNNNNTLKGVNETLDLIDNVIDEVSGVDYTIKFKEEKKYKSFSEKFGVGK